MLEICAIEELPPEIAVGPKDLPADLYLVKNANGPLIYLGFVRRGLICDNRYLWAVLKTVPTFGELRKLRKVFDETVKFGVIALATGKENCRFAEFFGFTFLRTENGINAYWRTPK